MDTKPASTNPAPTQNKKKDVPVRRGGFCEKCAITSGMRCGKNDCPVQD